MARYFVTHQHAEINCGIIVVSMTTNTPRHLTLLWSVSPPTTRPIPYRGQESTVPHSNFFTLYIDGDVEQEEPGNTQTHTFRWAFPINATAVYFYTIDFGTGKTKSTRSPIFVYTLNFESVVDEQWPNGGLTPTIPWVTDFVRPGREVRFPANQARLDSIPNINNVTNWLALLPPSVPQLVELNNCTMSLTLSFPLFGGQSIGQRPGIFMEWDDLVDGNHYTVQFVPDLDYDYMSLGPLLAPNTAYFVTGNQRRTYSFRQIAFAVGAEVPISWVNPLDDRMWNVTFAFAVGSADGPGPRILCFYGPFNVSLNQGTLTDVSGEWKGKRLYPKFR